MRWGGRRNKKVGDAHDRRRRTKASEVADGREFRQVADWERCCKYCHSPLTRMIAE
jgi:hypothetical protein